MSAEQELASRLRQVQTDRWGTATVLEVLDAEHARVNFENSDRVAVVPAGTVVVAGQSVEVTVSGRVTTVRRPLDGNGWITGGFTAASGWAVTEAAYRTVSGIRFINVNIERTGATLTASSTGHLADTGVVSVPAAAMPVTPWPVNEVSGCWRTSTTFGGLRLNTSRMLMITDLHPGGSIIAGDYAKAMISFPV